MPGAGQIALVTRLPALLMTPPAGAKRAERWMAEGRLAAASDLVRALAQSEGIGPIYLLAAEAEDRRHLQGLGAIAWDGPDGPFHFGRALAAFAESTGAEALAYFGGASAPLLAPALADEACDRLRRGRGPLAVVNNLHSTDWIFLNSASALAGIAHLLPTDNPLGWVLSHEAGFGVESLPASAATRADVDTPADLLLLTRHPDLGPAVRQFLAGAPGHLTHHVESLLEVVATPASTLAVIGRSSSHLWQLLERRAQIWVRLFVEERGMLASGRMTRHEVRSLLGEALDTWGPREFVRRLSEMSDAVVWDTRVWMATHGDWPSAADRFAADLGWAEEVDEPGLRALTEAILQAPIPILTGGHGVVSGSALALLEALPESGSPTT
ncbi:MAG: hypothetical protein A2Z66_13330 [Chloroflexi bacterium RBG_13_66_10]|nr:MAG: hypothetical protein A2Z66_13330 [Chloroflexi bacterium RBG_13_66_10]